MLTVKDFEQEYIRLLMFYDNMPFTYMSSMTLQLLDIWNVHLDRRNSNNEICFIFKTMSRKHEIWICIEPTYLTLNLEYLLLFW